MRKYLIMALAAVLSIAVASVALAANAAPDVTAKLTPANAGTKKKPKNSTRTGRPRCWSIRSGATFTHSRSRGNGGAGMASGGARTR